MISTIQGSATYVDLPIRGLKHYRPFGDGIIVVNVSQGYSYCDSQTQRPQSQAP